MLGSWLSRALILLWRISLLPVLAIALGRTGSVPIPGACLQVFGFLVWIINMKQDWCLPLGSVFLQGTYSRPVLSAVLSPEPRIGSCNVVSTQEMVSE